MWHMKCLQNKYFCQRLNCQLREPQHPAQALHRAAMFQARESLVLGMIYRTGD